MWSSNEEYRTGGTKIDVESFGIPTEFEDEVSHIRDAKTPKVQKNSDIRTTHVLISSKLSKVYLKSPTYSFGRKDQSSDDVPVSKVSL